MSTAQQDEIGLAEAAQRLGISWQRAWRLVLTGALDGHQRDGRWYVHVESVAAMKTVVASGQRMTR